MGLLTRLFGTGTGTALSPDDRARQERSWAELKAGRLPVSAQERLADQAAGHAFAAELSTGDLVAVRAAGYEAVGQAFGTSTVAINRTQARLQSQSPFVYGYGSSARYGSSSWPIRGFYEGELKSRQRAMRRMQDECRALGGEGVIGVRAIRSHIGDGLYEYTVIGTAIRTAHRRVDAIPFLAALGGADFGALARSGWRPVTMVMSMVRWAASGIGAITPGGPSFTISRWSGTRELSVLSDLQTKARTEARANLERQVRTARADGMLLHNFEVDWDCESERWEIAVEALGTAIVRSGPTSSRPKTRPLLDVRPVVRLDGGDSIDL